MKKEKNFFHRLYFSHKIIINYHAKIFPCSLFLLFFIRSIGRSQNYITIVYYRPRRCSILNYSLTRYNLRLEFIPRRDRLAQGFGIISKRKSNLVYNLDFFTPQTIFFSLLTLSFWHCVLRFRDFGLLPFLYLVSLNVISLIFHANQRSRKFFF